VKYQRGKAIGNVEESFLSRLREGDSFWFAGRSLELVRIKDMQAIVINSAKKSGKIPVWGGGRLSFSSNMSAMLRKKLNEIVEGRVKDVELLKLKPLIDLQSTRSKIPGQNELLMEYF